MELSEDQKAAIFGALRNKVGDRIIQCPISGDSNWRIENKLALVPATEDPKGSILSGHVFPNVVLSCQSCGYTALLNLIILGLAEEFGVNPELAANVAE